MCVPALIITSYSRSCYSQDRDGDEAQIQAELNMACLRTSVKLLDRLQLRPVDVSNTGDDTVHVVSRLFNKYSGALLQGLQACLADNCVGLAQFPRRSHSHFYQQTSESVSDDDKASQESPLILRCPP